MNRRGFLRALAATSLAPLIPSIANSPFFIESAQFEDIIAGRVPLYLGLGGDKGAIKSFGRKLVNLGEPVSFGQITEACTVTHAILATEDGSWGIPIYFGGKQSYALEPGDTFNLFGFNVHSLKGGAA